MKLSTNKKNWLKATLVTLAVSGTTYIAVVGIGTALDWVTKHLFGHELGVWFIMAPLTLYFLIAGIRETKEQMDRRGAKKSVPAAPFEEGTDA